jgi:hypothetical protein
LRCYIWRVERNGKFDFHSFYKSSGGPFPSKCICCAKEPGRKLILFIYFCAWPLLRPVGLNIIISQSGINLYFTCHYYFSFVLAAEDFKYLFFHFFLNQKLTYRNKEYTRVLIWIDTLYIYNWTSLHNPTLNIVTYIMMFNYNWILQKAFIFMADINKSLAIQSYGLL